MSLDNQTLHSLVRFPSGTYPFAGVTKPLAAADSCGMVAACEFFVCKLVLLLLVAATLLLLVAATLRLLVAALSCSNLAAHCLLQPCGLCVFRMQIRFLALSCSLFAANSCSLFAANSCGLFAANSCGLFAATDCKYQLA